MPLAFYPFGAFLAGFALGAMFALFAVGLRLVDRAVGGTAAGGSVLPGLVSGFRDWADGRHGPRIPVSTSPAATDAGSGPEGPEIIELR